MLRRPGEHAVLEWYEVKRETACSELLHAAEDDQGDDGEHEQASDRHEQDPAREFECQTRCGKVNGRAGERERESTA